MADDALTNLATKRKRLAQRRKSLGLTQESLAGILSVERSTVVRWERGESEPQPWIRPKLAKALRVSADRLEALLASSGIPRNDGTAQDRNQVPRQLPAAIADFTGRAGELGALSRILDGAGAGKPGAVVISAIGGTAGVGKTALALHWAHHVAGRFPDGQLHVNLRGFDPSGTPATAAEVILGFLDALAVPPQRIPPTPDGQVALYRSLLADKRMLIVLDNASDEQQVRPLLPASPASLVIVTSRNRLAGLVATDGARLLSLDVLAHDEAVRMLTVRIGASRAAAEREAVDELAALCARLPLALAITAAQAAAHPLLPLTEMAAELRDTADRLDALDAGDPAVSVRAVFSWSYQQLGPDSLRMFRLLGLHPGPDITAPAAASLAAISEPEARRLLRELTRAHLISEHVNGRHAFHDLLRAYATGQARDLDSEPSRDAAIGRILDHYLHTASHSATLLQPSREQVTLAQPSPGTCPERPADHRQALAWFDAEHQVLLAAITLAVDTGADRHAWQLPCAMMEYLYRRGYPDERVTIMGSALAAATHQDDTLGQAVSLRYLGSACTSRGNYDQARAHLEQCRRSGAERGFATAKDPASNNIARGWCRLTGLAPLMLFTTVLLAVRNQRILTAWDARQEEDARRAARGLPPRARRRRRKTLSPLAAAAGPP